MSFAAEWKAAKTQFEIATDRKKPSSKFLGLRKGASLATATKALDDALLDGNAAQVARAKKVFDDARVSYLKVLQKAAHEDGSVDMRPEMVKLDRALEDIAYRFDEACKKLGASAQARDREIAAERRKVEQWSKLASEVKRHNARAT